MAEEYEYFNVAYNKLVKLSADDVKRMQYERHERNIRDIQVIEQIAEAMEETPDRVCELMDKGTVV